MTCWEERKIKKREMQCIIGELSFAAAVVPARPFIRWLIDSLANTRKQHHYITINLEMRKDLQTWLQFLENYKGITNFRMLNMDTHSIQMSSDASRKGFGAVFGKEWIQEEYPQDWMEMGITVLEFYPMLVLMAVFGSRLQNANIIWLCDNQAVTTIVNKQTSKTRT